MMRAVNVAAERAEFAEALRAAGVTCIFQNAGEEGNDPLRLLKRLARFTLSDRHAARHARAGRAAGRHRRRRTGRASTACT